MKKDVTIYIDDILEAIDAIERYVKDMDEVVFSQKDYMQDAVIRQLAIIGEAARNIPDEVKQKQIDIPWRKISDFRNVLIHEYSGISLGTVWEIVVGDLPILREQLLSLKKLLNG